MTRQVIHVLLIEDSPDDALLIGEFLADARQAVFEVEHFEWLSAALARLAKGGIDVVLLDLQLPDSRGLDTFRAVQNASPAVPVGRHEATWKQLVEDSRMVIGGSPDTVAAQIEEAVRNIRVGHLMVILQIQSMDPELTAYSSGLFAEKVLPKIRGIWDKEGYADRWWPQGATRNQPQLARSAAKVSNGEAKVTA